MRRCVVICPHPTKLCGPVGVCAEPGRAAAFLDREPRPVGQRPRSEAVSVGPVRVDRRDQFARLGASRDQRPCTIAEGRAGGGHRHLAVLCLGDPLVSAERTDEDPTNGTRAALCYNPVLPSIQRRHLTGPGARQRAGVIAFGPVCASPIRALVLFRAATLQVSDAHVWRSVAIADGAAALGRAGKGGVALRETGSRNADAFAASLAPTLEDIQGNEHASLRAIAAEPDARRIVTRRSGQWYVSNVSNLLTRVQHAMAAIDPG